MGDTRGSERWPDVLAQSSAAFRGLLVETPKVAFERMAQAILRAGPWSAQLLENRGRDGQGQGAWFGRRRSQCHLDQVKLETHRHRRRRVHLPHQVQEQATVRPVGEFVRSSCRDLNFNVLVALLVAAGQPAATAPAVPTARDQLWSADHVLLGFAHCGWHDRVTQ